MRRLFFGLLLTLLPCWALAQQPVVPCNTRIDANNNTSCTPIAQSTATTPVAGTITIGGTSQQVFAANSGRKGCFIINTNATDKLYIGVGVAASTTNGQSIPLTAGQVFYCSNNVTVVGNAINITGANTSDTFTAMEDN